MRPAFAIFFILSTFNVLVHTMNIPGGDGNRERGESSSSGRRKGKETMDPVMIENFREKYEPMIEKMRKNNLTEEEIKMEIRKITQGLLFENIEAIPLIKMMEAHLNKNLESSKAAELQSALNLVKNNYYNRGAEHNWLLETYLKKP